MDMIEVIINNTETLLKSYNQTKCTRLLIENNRRIFEEAYELDLFQFIPYTLLRNYYENKYKF